MQALQKLLNDNQININQTQLQVIAIAAPVIILFTYFIIANKGSSNNSYWNFIHFLEQNSFLVKGKLMKVKLIDKRKISHDTYILKFGLPDKTVLGIKVGEHIKIVQQIGNETVERKYTPVSHVDQEGQFDLLIKIYRPNEHPKFPEGGKLTPWLEKLEINNEITISGPLGRLNYISRGQFFYERMDTGKYVKRTYKNVCLIGGGTGITPLYQVIQSTQRNQNDKTNLSLLFANKEEKDILMLQQLQECASKGLKLNFTLDNPPSNWTQLSGFVSEDMIKKCFPAPSEDTLFLLCGPPPMCNMLIKMLKEMKYTNIFKF